ncbi:EscU/YscU/HrcU family type III secretion system export apparatus switch protein [Cytobacillus sp. Hm23]
MSEKVDLIREAIALKYDREKKASPTIIGKGKGIVAENIISVAEEHNIPLQEDPTLVNLLSQLNINEAIPEELYEAVAEIFAFIYRVDKQQGER